MEPPSGSSGVTMYTTGDVILYKNASKMLRLQVPARIANEDKRGIGTISFTATFHAGSAPTQKIKRWLPYKLDGCLTTDCVKTGYYNGLPVTIGRRSAIAQAKTQSRGY